MGDVSNKTIVALLAVALVVTVVGTLVSVSKLSDLGGSYFTGAAVDTASGTSSIEIQGSTSITNNVASINFGAGNVLSSATECVMNTEGQHNQTGPNCISFSNVTAGFLLENTGNLNLSVNYTCAGNCTAAQFIGGTNPAFEFKVEAAFGSGNTGTETSTADSATSCTGAVGFTGTSYTDVTAAGAYLCGSNTVFDLDFTDSADAFSFDINVSVPVDAPSDNGVAETATFTFNALSSG